MRQGVMWPKIICPLALDSKSLLTLGVGVDQSNC